MNKSFLSISIIFFGICIVLGSWFISDALKRIANNQYSDTVNVNQEQNRYELIVVNDNNLIFFDKVSGDHWRRFIESDAGPANWEKQPLPWE